MGTAWFAYEFSPLDVVTGLRKLLGLANVHVDDAGKVARVRDWIAAGLACDYRVYAPDLRE